ncbi:uncharacterized protein LOC142345777 isoform X3 [Convolutriloba macropyga]|uniref:uncharacterized protein LOC142345777 isoform X3 n=1 Tax=Convolutriloba macropyga TaxID=536237 RepID=UPI003F5269FC
MTTVTEGTCSQTTTSTHRFHSQTSTCVRRWRWITWWMQLLIVLLLLPSILQGCEDSIHVVDVSSPMLTVDILDRSSVRISNPYLKPPADKTRNKDSKEGTDGSRSGKDGGATDSVLKPSDQQQQNPSSSSASDGNGNGAVGGDEGGNSISKREAHSPAPLSNQYFTVRFDSVYTLKSIKVKSGERYLSVQYSRESDPIAYQRRYSASNGNWRLMINEYFPTAKMYIQNSLTPPMVMSEMRINLMNKFFDNSSLSPTEFSISFEHGACKFNEMESYTITEPSEEHPDFAYDGKAVNGYLTGGLGSLILGSSSDDQYVEWLKTPASDDLVQMDFAFRSKQNVTAVEFNFDKPISYLVYSPEQITCYALFERDQDISKGVSRSVEVESDASSVRLKLDFVAYKVHCEMMYRTSSDASIRLHLVQFTSRPATLAEIEAADPNKDKIEPVDGIDSNSTDIISGGDNGGGGVVPGGLDDDDGGSGSGDGSGSGGNGNGGNNPRVTNPPPFGLPGENMQYLTMFIVVLAILCGVILTIIGLGVGWMWYRKKKMKLKKKYESAYSKGEFFGTGPPSEHPYQALSQLDQYETPRYHMNAATLDVSRQLPDLPQHHPGFQPHDGGTRRRSNIPTKAAGGGGGIYPNPFRSIQSSATIPVRRHYDDYAENNKGTAALLGKEATNSGNGGVRRRTRANMLPGVVSSTISHMNSFSSNSSSRMRMMGGVWRRKSSRPGSNRSSTRETVFGDEPYYWSLASSRIYTEPDLVSQIRDNQQPNTLTRGAAGLNAANGGGDSLARNVARAYAETDITQIQEAAEDPVDSGIFGGTFEMSNVLEYPKQNLVFLKELGKGQFATVHLCLAPGIRDSNPDTPVKVAVKFLHQDALYEQREAFKKEVKVLSDLRHPNIIMLYGVCTRSGPPMMILEFMENGDLYQFLRRHEPELGTYASSSNIQTLSAGTLVYMARQIAAGMSHVESVNFIHRDLASRNCLVGLSYTVKIGDFGMSRELYSNDYYKIEGKAVLPIRWMAWESIVMGKFSNKSDVWSFGVLLWELFTLAKCQPFSNRTDEQVIENLTNIWEKKESETLPQPGNCPNEVFDLMKKCWHSSPDLRPNFKELHSQLTKLNTLDYSPSTVPGGPPPNPNATASPSAIVSPSTSSSSFPTNPPLTSTSLFSPPTTSSPLPPAAQQQQVPNVISPLQQMSSSSSSVGMATASS